MPSIVMSKEERDERGLELTKLIQADMADRSEALARRHAIRRLYNGPTIQLDNMYALETPMHVNLLEEKIEAEVPKINNAFWGIDPHVNLRRVATQDYDPTDTREISYFINWSVDNDIEDLFDAFNTWTRNMLIDGVAVAKIYWERKWRNISQVYQVKKLYLKDEVSAAGVKIVQPRPKNAEEVAHEIFGAANISIIDRPSELEFVLDVIEDRRRLENVNLRIENSEFIDEYKVTVFRPILANDSPVFETIDFDHFIVPYRTKSIDKASRIAQKHWMTSDQIRQAREHDANWQLTDEELEDFEEMVRGTGQYQSEINDTSIQEHKDKISGQHDTKTTPTDNIQKNAGLLYEVYVRHDINNDGRDEEVIYQVCPGMNTVFAVSYLEEVHPHGLRPYASIHYRRNTNSFYGPGMGEDLAYLNIEANILLNQINKNQELLTKPIVFYEPAALSGVDPDQWVELMAGSAVPTDNAQGIMIPQWTQFPSPAYELMATLLMSADKVSLPPLASGSTQQRNSPRTARATLALLSESGINTDLDINSIKNSGWKRMMQILYGLYGQYLPDEKYFWVTGSDKKKKPISITRKALQHKIEFEFLGNTVNTNPEFKRILSERRYQIGATNPLYASDPRAFRELLRDIYQNNSEGTNIDAILPGLPGQGAEPHPPMAQKDEITIMRHGMPVEVLQSDNHVEHIGELRALLASKAFEEYSPISVALIGTHLNTHMTMLKQQQQQQRVAQSQGGGEQNIPADLGGLEGGAT